MASKAWSVGYCNTLPSTLHMYRVGDQVQSKGTVLVIVTLCHLPYRCTGWRPGTNQVDIASKALSVGYCKCNTLPSTLQVYRVGDQVQAKGIMLVIVTLYHLPYRCTGLETRYKPSGQTARCTLPRLMKWWLMVKLSTDEHVLKIKNNFLIKKILKNKPPPQQEQF